MIKSVYSVLSKLRALAIIAILAFVIALCLLQIVLRYLTSDDLRPFAWGDEIIRLAAIWVVFLAASLGVRESSHLSVDFFVNKYLPARGVAALKRIATLIVLAVLVALTYYGVIQTQMNIPSMLENLSMSPAWFYAAIPVGCAYLFIDYALILVYGAHPFSSAALAAGGEDEAASATAGEV